MKKKLLQQLIIVTKFSFFGLIIQCLLLNIVLASGTTAQSFKSVKDVDVTVKFNKTPLKKVFTKLETLTDFYFTFDNDDDFLKETFDLDKSNISVESLLIEISKKNRLSFRQVNKSISVRKLEGSEKKKEIEVIFQTITVRGVVTSLETNEPIPGVNVVIKGTNNGTITNVDGEFSIEVPGPESILILSSIGYTSEEITVGNRSQIIVSMVPDIRSLQEVVVVGFGTQKKEAVTGAISSVETKELLQSPVSNISNALVGRMPGLFAMQESGEPGDDASKLRIRGTGTFSGQSDPLIMVDGIQVDNFNNIDPNEIESVTILKDASSTAIYGVRGANGVILITTKRGKKGKPQLSFSTNVAVLSFTDLRKQMSSYDYARYFNQALENDSYITGVYNPRFTSEDIEKYRSGEDPIFYPDTDWYSTLFKSSSIQTQHNLNISGGTEKVQYFISGGLFTQEGLFNTKSYGDIEEYDPNRVHNRYNFRSNFNFEVTSRMRVRVDVSSQTENTRGTTSESSNIIEKAARATPIGSPGLIDGKVANLTGLGTITNPIASLYADGYRRRFRNYLQGSVRLDHDLDFITKGLVVHGLLNYQNNNIEQLTNRRGGGFVVHNAIRLPDGTVNLVPQGIEQPFGYTQEIEKSRRAYTEFGLNYSREFGDHYVTGMVNYNQMKLFDPKLAFLVPNALQAVVGRATYEFKSRYMAEFTFGYNGTENFAEGKRFGFFPAYSLGWVFSEESFFPKGNAITFAKVRGSYGEVGNDRIGNFDDPNTRFLYRPSSFTQINNGYYFGEVGSTYTAQRFAREGRLGNPDLTWERAFKSNLGVEFRLWANRISITADVFREKRDNILANLGTVPFIVGATLPAYNLGKMTNQGFEGDIVYNDNIGKFNYWIRGNYTFARNQVDFQDEVNRPFPYQMRTGQRFEQQFGLVADGLYNSWDEVNDVNRPVSAWNSNKLQPGDIRYKDVNGDGIINFDDQVPIGYSRFPEKVFGISFGGRYKGFDFSALFQGTSNVSFIYHRRQIRGFFENTGAVDYLVQSWSQERYDQGLATPFPRLTEDGGVYPHNYQNSTFWVADGSYLRLKNAEIGYNLNQNLLSKIGLADARIYVNGNNLITWDNLLPGIDPESQTLGANDEPYPLVRTMNLGIKVKF